MLGLRTPWFGAFNDYCVERLLQQLVIIHVGGGDHERQRTAGAVREHALFCAILSTVSWIGANVVAAHTGFAQPSVCGLPHPFDLPELVALGE